LAIGSALLQGYDVRLSGQDVGRATFSHRHAMLVCQQTDRVHIPLNHLDEKQNSFLEVNSKLFKFNKLIPHFRLPTVHWVKLQCLALNMGFPLNIQKDWSFGRFLNSQNWAKIEWNLKAQFGDFYNGAQIQIDTMIASGESNQNTNQYSKLIKF
jgi:probable 2-oxoglutarate dehydrogenase E1 component DHKTD1